MNGNFLLIDSRLHAKAKSKLGFALISKPPENREACIFLSLPLFHPERTAQSVCLFPSHQSFRAETRQGLCSALSDGLPSSPAPSTPILPTCEAWSTALSRKRRVLTTKRAFNPSKPSTFHCSLLDYLFSLHPVAGSPLRLSLHSLFGLRKKIMASNQPQPQLQHQASQKPNNLDRYVIIHVATTCDEHGVYVTKDSAEVIELGWILLDANSCEEVTTPPSKKFKPEASLTSSFSSIVKVFS